MDSKIILKNLISSPEPRFRRRALFNEALPGSNATDVILEKTEVARSG